MGKTRDKNYVTRSVLSHVNSFPTCTRMHEKYPYSLPLYYHATANQFWNQKILWAHNVYFSTDPRIQISMILRNQEVHSSRAQPWQLISLNPAWSVSYAALRQLGRSHQAWMQTKGPTQWQQQRWLISVGIISPPNAQHFEVKKHMRRTPCSCALFLRRVLLYYNRSDASDWLHVGSSQLLFLDSFV